MSTKQKMINEKTITNSTSTKVKVNLENHNKFHVYEVENYNTWKNQHIMSTKWKKNNQGTLKTFMSTTWTKINQDTLKNFMEKYQKNQTTFTFTKSNILVEPSTIFHVYEVEDSKFFNTATHYVDKMEKLKSKSGIYTK